MWYVVREGGTRGMWYMKVVHVVREGATCGTWYLKLSKLQDSIQYGGMQKQFM